MLALTSRKYKLSLVRILAVDTSAAEGSLALIAGGRLVEEAALLGQRYSETLMPAIARLLERHGCGPSGLDGLAVAVGPGAFTGLRVGLAAIQGLAVGAARRCVGVDSLCAWAHLFPREARLAVVLDAMRGEVLTALFEHGRLLRPAWLSIPERLGAQLPDSALLVGAGASVHRDALAASARGVRFASATRLLAGAVGELGAGLLAAGHPPPRARGLRPRYLRDAYAQNP